MTDLDKIIEAGYQTTSAFLLVNSSEYKEINFKIDILKITKAGKGGIKNESES